MRSILLLPALLLLPAPAAAQSVIRPGQSVTGSLSDADPTLDDGSRYDVWRFQGQANHRYRVTLHSDEFDAFLTVGADIQPGCDDCATDDDGGGGTDAQVEYTGSADGTYAIRANSFGVESGRYELTLEDEGVVEAVEEHEHDDGPAPMGTPIALDETVTGELAAGDRKVDGLMYNDTYTYQGRAGEILTIVLRSADFNTLVTVGAYEAGECTQMDADDDGGGGTDSRLTVALFEDGPYHIHVTSAEAGETGRYTLLVERGQPSDTVTPPTVYEATTLTADSAVTPAEPIRPGSSISGWLAEGDRRSAQDSAWFDLYSYRATAGETVTIELISEDFDAYLRVGRWVEGGWEELGSDDDGGGGTHSLLTLTFPQDGEYEILARSLYTGQAGRYHVSVARN